MRRAPNSSNYELPTTVASSSRSLSPAPRSGGCIQIDPSCEQYYNGSKETRGGGTSRIQKRKLLIRQSLLTMAVASLLCYYFYGDSYFAGDDSSAEVVGDNDKRKLHQNHEQQNPTDDNSRRPQDHSIQEGQAKPNSKKEKDPCPPPPFQSLTFGGAVNPGYFRPQDAIIDKPSGENVGGTSFKFAAIADLDKLSKVKDAERPTFHADLLEGTLQHHPSTSDTENQYYTVSFEPSVREIVTHLNEGGRGAEYSELTLFQDRLLTFDDRTGAVIELLNSPDGKATYPITRYVFGEGDGDNLSQKGMKYEWATVKGDSGNEELYIGGIGKELQLPNGEVDTKDAMWITIIGPQGQLKRVDWSPQYNFVRKFLGCQLPGYIAHEAIEYSNVLKKWVFLPRRVSTHQYVPELDERLGSNKVIVVNEEFTDATVIEIDLEHNGDAGLRGFSRFSFIPNTQDQHVLAIRSVEDNCHGNDLEKCEFRTYICVFELLTGDVLMKEQLIENHPVKFEGIEFVDISAKPPMPPTPPEQQNLRRNNRPSSEN